METTISMPDRHMIGSSGIANSSSATVSPTLVRPCGVAPRSCLAAPPVLLRSIIVIPLMPGAFFYHVGPLGSNLDACRHSAVNVTWKLSNDNQRSTLSNARSAA